MQSHASPGGGVGTNFVKARSRLGSPRMPQHMSRTGTGEAGPGCPALGQRHARHYRTAGRGWNQTWTAEDIYKDVDYWAAQGVRGFKAKGISPQHLKPLVERAHMHGLTVTGHFDSGFRNSTNAKDAIRMIKVGVVYDPSELLRSVEGKIGPKEN
jgi:hypothetical protein